MEAQLGQPAAAPDPVCLHRIDESGDHRRVDAVGKELGALCHGAGYDGGGGCAENKVEHEIGPVKVLITGENIKTRLADQTQQVFPQEQIKADQNKYNRTNAEVHQVLHQDVAGILGPGKASLHHGKACLHPENKSRADQKPNAEHCGVNGTNDTCVHHSILQENDFLSLLPALQIKKRRHSSAGRSDAFVTMR